LYYGWVVVGVALTAMVCAAGLRALPGPLMLPLEQEFGWDRATISVAVAINMLLLGLIGPLIGRLADTRGPKAVMLGGLSLLVVSLLGLLLVREAWHLWLMWGVVGGLGAGASTGVLVATLSSRWFTKSRGLVIGILSASGSAGQLVFLPLVMSLIVHDGWRSAIALVAGLLVVVALPLVALLMKDDPAEVGQTIEGESPARASRTAGAAVFTGNPYRTTDFWLLAASYFICGFTTLGLIGTHFVPHALDHGIPEVATASILGLMGFMNFFGTTGAGWLSDRFDKRLILASIYGLRSLSLLALPFLGDTASLGVFAVVYGLDWIATVPPTVGLCADLFGRSRAGVVYGFVFLSHQIGAAAAAYLGGLARVTLGDYQAAFLGAGVLAVLAVGLSLRLSKPAPKLAAAAVGAG
jgi:MFS family permease